MKTILRMPREERARGWLMPKARWDAISANRPVGAKRAYDAVEGDSKEEGNMRWGICR